MTDNQLKVFHCIKNAERVSGNEIKITYKKIAELTGLDIQMVSGQIKGLCLHGYVERITHKNSTGGCASNTYKIRRYPARD